MVVRALGIGGLTLIILAIAVWSAPVWIAGQSIVPVSQDRNLFDVTILNHDGSGVTAEIVFQGFRLEETDEGGYRVLGDGWHQIQAGDLPKLPQWNTWINLGRDDAASVTILDQERRVVKGYPLEQIRPGEALFQGQWFPEEGIYVGEPVVVRDIRMASLNVFPVRAEVDGDALEITSRMVVRIDRIPGVGANPKVGGDRPIPYGFAKLYGQLLLGGLDETEEIIGDHLLIITPDTWVDELQPVVEWRREKGIKVSVTRFSEIGANPGTQYAIRNHLTDVYNNWLDVPDYVLFVGDETQFPIHSTFTPDPVTMFSTYSYPGTFIDDNWYVCQDGDDYFPEFYLGRWVVNTTSEVELLVRKLLIHERDLFMQDSTWFRRAIVAADYTEPTMRETKTYVKYLLLQHGFQQVDSVFYGGSGLFASFVNAGRNFVNYRGSGWYYGWAGIPFFVSDVEALTNYYKLPIVTGIGCGVAKFDVSDDDCFGERWMTLGSATNPRGAAGFIGPTWNTHTAFNDVLDKGIYHALLDSAMLELSPILLSGKMHMYNFFQPYFNQDPNIIEVVRSAFNQYMNLSDPELDLFTSMPRRVVIEHPPFALIGTHLLDVTVLDQVGEGIPGARVCAYVDSAHCAVGATDSHGEVSLGLTIVSADDSVLITISSANVYPSQVIIPVSPSGAWLRHYELVIRDQTQGNGDGMLNPGELADLHEVLINEGNANAVDVQGVLSTAEPTVTITQNQATYGNIAPEDTAGSVPDYRVGLSTSYTIGHTLEFMLTISDTGSVVREVPINIPVATPNLEIVECVVDDGNNGRWDVGETVDLVLRVANIGLQGMPESEVRFRTSDPHVLVHDSVGILPAAAPGDTVDISANRFRVESLGNTLPETIVDYAVFATNQFQTYTYSQSSPSSIMIGLITPECPTYDDSMYYFAYDTGDTCYTECPEYEWIEIAPQAGGPGTALPFNHTDQTFPVSLPFHFAYYGQDYDHVSVSTDGWMAMGSTTMTSYINATLPTMDGISAMIAPFWDDLWHPQSEQGQIATYYESVDNLFIVEYYRVGHYSNANQRETFQVVLFNPAVYQTVTGDGEFTFAYREITANGIQNSTTGIESPSQQNGIEYNFNGTHPVSAFELHNNLAIKFTTDPPELISGVPTQDGESLIPRAYVLDQNYPNPFNPVTAIRFGLPRTGEVRLVLFNILGQRVATLVDNRLDAGYHQVVWNGRDQNGVSCAAGVYFYRMQAGEVVMAKKMVLLK